MERSSKLLTMILVVLLVGFTVEGQERKKKVVHVKNVDGSILKPD
ncbi:hypothetical protein Leryth_026337 [Lithospermum erythrorhizon]|nr:hypothetical protein Leryth_026337 [Lithospermum erythrorhizon]